jgi:hypothetical protein
MSQVIVGAGLAGLIAACHFKDATIIDAASGPMATHQALLRFRTTAVSELTGIPFKKVTVQKAISGPEGLKTTCSIKDSNEYAYKVSGGVTGRSINNLEPVVRYIAPHDFYDCLVARHHKRIQWNTPFDEASLSGHRVAFPTDEIISTAPMPVNLTAAGIAHGTTFGSFSKAPIDVWRCKLKCPSDVYQTIYFPQADRLLFRASITGDTLIVESLQSLPNGRRYTGLVSYRDVWESFGLHESQLDLESAVKSSQPFGKIVDMPKADREALMHELTNAHGIFSLGRFATWRNILLDDVVDDIESISNLINASEYSRKLILANSSK